MTLGGFGVVALLACTGGSTPPPPPPPVITSFGAAKTTITAGTSTTLTAVYSNGTGMVDKGVGAIASNTPLAVTPTADTTYTLTVTNTAGAFVTSATTVLVVPPPTTPTIMAPALVTSGQGGYAASVPSQGTGSTYAWTLTNGTITAGSGSHAITFTAGASGQVGLKCIVTNAAGQASAEGSTTAEIVAAPVLPVITVPAMLTSGASYTASVPAQANSTYAWTVTGGT
ncbi:MAG: hypothetical protein LWX11_09105, partial [Firmicutes bacterium]|nr:hypothetical protein [Bacillota bacterium]